jgi:hypothetical protein
MSISGDADFGFRNRGDVRRLRIAAEASFELLALAEPVEDAEWDDALDEIDVNGGRAAAMTLVCPELASPLEPNLAGSGRSGDESVRSISSTSLLYGRSSGGAGIAVVLIAG